MKRNLTPYLPVFFFLVSCVHQVDVPTRTVVPQLVVEGWITTDSTPYTIRLSYTGPFTNTYQVSQDTSKYFITDARVTIMDDLGDSTPCIWTGSGNYLSADSNFIGTIGRTYTLRIYLSNGKTYLSKPETIYPVPPIDSLTLYYDTTWITDVRPNQFIISVHTHDPVGTRNYYRWTASAYIARKSWGGSCIPGLPVICGDPFSCLCFALCDQYVAENDINILSNQLINGHEIIQPACYIPIYWFGKDFLQINQYSISENVYSFWEQYQAQTNRTGSILDPLPSPVIGNIYNAIDSTDIALGIFSASAGTSQRWIIAPLNLQQYWLEDIAGEFIEPGDCQLTYPGALPDFTDPPGWENVPELKVY
jgi:hypothetical protein